VTEPKELTVPNGHQINDGDILTIEGIYNRPSARTLAWWLMLAFHPARVCRYLPWVVRRRISDPMSFFPTTRRGLFTPRTLQTFKVGKRVTSA
jgi:hypothetical protein